MGERVNGIHEVGGSIPPGSTNQTTEYFNVFMFNLGCHHAAYDWGSTGEARAAKLGPSLLLDAERRGLITAQRL
jgi:hypothetical protein